MSNKAMELARTRDICNDDNSAINYRPADGNLDVTEGNGQECGDHGNADAEPIIEEAESTDVQNLLEENHRALQDAIDKLREAQAAIRQAQNHKTK